MKPNSKEMKTLISFVSSHSKVIPELLLIILVSIGLKIIHFHVHELLIVDNERNVYDKRPPFHDQVID